MNLRPLADRVIVEPIEEKYEGVIIIPDAAKEKPTKGRVLSVGRGARENGIIHEIDLKPGNVVLFGKYAGNEIEVEGRTVYIMHESDIYAVVE